MSPDVCIAAIEGYFELYNAKDARLFRRNKKPEDLVEAKKNGNRNCRNRRSDMESNHWR